MKKREFLAEITEIVNGATSDSVKAATISLVKELIRGAARQGLKEITLYARYNLPMDINGGQLTLSALSTLEHFRVEGFQAVDQGNGYVRISWE